MQPCPQDTTPRDSLHHLDGTFHCARRIYCIYLTKDADNTLNDAPTWDTSPNTSPNKSPNTFQELMAWLPKQESRFTLLVQLFVALERGNTCCVSENHSQRIDMGLLVKGSFKAPTLVKPSDMVMVPPGRAPAPPATPTPAPLAGGTAPSAAPTISANSRNNSRKPFRQTNGRRTRRLRLVASNHSHYPGR